MDIFFINKFIRGNDKLYVGRQLKQYIGNVLIMMTMMMVVVVVVVMVTIKLMMMMMMMVVVVVAVQMFM